MTTIPRSQRWSAVSGTANLDTGYRQLWSKPDKAYKYICWCEPPFPTDDSDSDEDEDDDEDEDEDVKPKPKSKSKPKSKPTKRKRVCDGGKTCLCDKPASEHPDHSLITTFPGRRKFLDLPTYLQLRDPSMFGMSTYSDHARLGVVQVIENLLLDFVEADSNWRDQWVVCETLGLFLQTEMIEDMMMVDDPEGVAALMRLIGRTFLSMLARLERDKLLSNDSEIKNLGLIMSLWARNAHDMRAQTLLEDPREETMELVGLDGTKETFVFDINEWDDYVVGYADRHSIPLPGPYEVADAAKKLPIQTLEDPWNTGAEFIKYERERGKSDGDQKPTIGGDSLDVTAWTSARRKEASDNRRDPLSKKEIEALKMGFMFDFE